MSIYACTMCHKRKPGPRYAVYMAALELHERYSTIHRVCAEDYESLAASTVDNMQLVDYDQDGQPFNVFPTCCWCGASTPDLLASFVTVYKPHEDRMDYFGSICVNCARSCFPNYEQYHSNS